MLLDNDPRVGVGAARVTCTTTVETALPPFGSDVMVAASAVTVNVDVDDGEAEGRRAVELASAGVERSVGREAEEGRGTLSIVETSVSEGTGPPLAIDGKGTTDGRAVLVNNPVVTNLSLDVPLALTTGGTLTTIDALGCPGGSAIVEAGRTGVDVSPSAADTNPGINFCRRASRGSGILSMMRDAESAVACR